MQKMLWSEYWIDTRQNIHVCAYPSYISTCTSKASPLIAKSLINEQPVYLFMTTAGSLRKVYKWLCNGFSSMVDRMYTINI